MTPSWDVPRADLAAQYRSLRPEIDAAIAGVLDRAELIGGPTIAEFERQIATRCGVAHAVGTSSGTSALHMALLAAGVKPGGEVIVPSFTFAATAAAVVHCGATPVFADIKEHDLMLDAERVEVTERTQAVVAVHVFGRVANTAPLAALDVPVVEDAAQALGASRDGECAGACGAVAAFSFHPSKNLGVMGDAGMVTTDDESAAELIRMYVNHGRDRSGRHEVAGFNHRLDALQAAVGLVKLRHLAAWNERRREIADTYAEGLADLDLVLPERVEGHVFHQYAVMTDHRDRLADHLATDGIATAKFYGRPVYAEPAYAQWAPSEPCRVAERVCRRALCLPIHEQLDDRQQQKVIASMQRFFRSRG